MLTRAISAPAHYGQSGILRYTPDSLPLAHSNVKFAPLPETEVFGRRAKFSSKLGVHGRSIILNKQRRHRNGINYDPNNAIEETPEAASHDDTTVPNDAAHGSTTQQASETAALHPPEQETALKLRRSASEDGTMSTSTKRGSGSLRFWKKPSKKPSLTTIPSQTVVETITKPTPKPTVAEPGPLGKSEVPPTPPAETPATTAATATTSPPESAENKDEDEGENPPVSAPTEPTDTIVPIPSDELTTSTTLEESPSEISLDKTMEHNSNQVVHGISFEDSTPLELSIHILDDKHTPPLAPLTSTLA